MRNAEAAIERELVDFETGLLDPKLFPHREHLRLGFEMLARYSFAETLQRFSGGLKLLAAKGGQPELYHETKTVRVPGSHRGTASPCRPNFVGRIYRGEPRLTGQTLP